MSWREQPVTKGELHDVIIQTIDAVEKNGETFTQMLVASGVDYPNQVGHIQTLHLTDTLQRLANKLEQS